MRLCAVGVARQESRSVEKSACVRLSNVFGGAAPISVSYDCASRVCGSHSEASRTELCCVVFGCRAGCSCCGSGHRGRSSVVAMNGRVTPCLFRFIPICADNTIGFTHDRGATENAHYRSHSPWQDNNIPYLLT